LLNEFYRSAKAGRITDAQSHIQRTSSNIIGGGGGGSAYQT